MTPAPYFEPCTYYLDIVAKHVRMSLMSYCCSSSSKAEGAESKRQQRKSRRPLEEKLPGEVYSAPKLELTFAFTDRKQLAKSTQQFNLFLKILKLIAKVFYLASANRVICVISICLLSRYN